MNLAIFLAAVTVITGMIRREFRDSAAVRSENVHRRGPPVFVSEWRDLIPDALSTASPTAPIQLIVFADMECPYCARFYLDIERQLAHKYAGQLNTAMVHLPLAIHRFAMPSAIAVECAAAQGTAAAFIELVYSKQDSIGLKPWESYAEEVKLPEMPGFLSCLKGGVPRRIEAGKNWASRLQVVSTPTILLNGWRFFGVVSENELSAAIDALLAGRPPFAGSDTDAK